MEYHWIGDTYDLAGVSKDLSLLCGTEDVDNTYGYCGLFLHICPTCPACLQRLPCNEQYPFVCEEY